MSRATTEVCQHCGALIQKSDDVWWVVGTCGSYCPAAPVDDDEWPPHSPALDLPDLQDPAAVEVWLSS